MIRPLTEHDYETWLELAVEVEPLFGPMVESKDFRDGIKKCIIKNDAFGIENENNELAGIIALDRKENEITWLAVAEIYRSNKYGERLVAKAIEELEINGDIYVQTFASGIEEGKRARAIYHRYGFSDLKNAGKNPAGIETVIMIKKNR